MVHLKRFNSKLKFLAAIGGANKDLDLVWTAMAANTNARNNFADNVLAFIIENQLDGIGKREELIFNLGRHLNRFPNSILSFLLHQTLIGESC